MRYEKEAKIFTNAIKEIAKKPENINNLESYLSRHFSSWLKKYANDPENMAEEMREFAEMQI